MIDPHVHLRDWDQKAKETVAHGIALARRIGFNALFDQCNTDPPLDTAANIRRRLELADRAIQEETGEVAAVGGGFFFYGVYGGVNGDEAGMKEMVRFADENPRVVGIKLFAGASTAAAGLREEEQRLYYRTAATYGYTGVTAVHCEKPGLFRDAWDPTNPISHTRARPPESEIAAVEDQIRFAREAGYSGTLHICHLSVPEALEAVEKARPDCPFRITCEATPHHSLLCDEMMNGAMGVYLKMNPPLRPRRMQRGLFQAVCEGRVDFVATDHAPHTPADKLRNFASGIPSWFLYGRLIRALHEAGVSRGLLEKLTHDNIVDIFALRDIVRNNALRDGPVRNKTALASIIESPPLSEEEIAEEYGVPRELLRSIHGMEG